ncbi:MAG: hypothetical protein PF444_07190, partial [Bacteroidales bacterium]|nr:hypothetical protein [Bacteroidales bacterium]
MDHTHIPLIHGHATFSGADYKPTLEMMTALNNMAEIAYNKADELILLSQEKELRKLMLNKTDNILRQFFEKYCEKLPNMGLEEFVKHNKYCLVEKNAVYWFEKNSVKCSPRFVWREDECITSFSIVWTT